MSYISEAAMKGSIELITSIKCFHFYLSHHSGNEEINKTPEITASAPRKKSGQIASSWEATL
jgi:hypothetical protein